MLLILHFIPSKGIVRLLLYLIPYLIVGYDVLLKAFKGIRNLQPMDECLLMSIATIGAIVLGIISDGDYTEAVAVMLFYQLGEWFQSYAVGRSRKNISELMDIRPDYANLETAEGESVRTDPDDVPVGSVIILKPGEKIPLDGIVISGSSSVDTSPLTGESVPVKKEKGDEVLSGCINLSGVIRVETTSEFEESTASKILDLVENATSRKSRSEKFITRFARVYTPAVVLSALALAFIPPVISLAAKGSSGWSTWLYRALTFLVISCPCALVISIPLTFFAGIGGASRRGILIKGSNYLETLSKCDTVVFDKTGTLTKGTFEVAGIHHSIMDEDRLLEYAAHAESASTHPISGGILRAYGKSIDPSRVKDIREFSGEGITAVVDGKDIAIGNGKLMERLGIAPIECHQEGTVVHMAVDGGYQGHILISDVIKPGSKDAVTELKKSGVKQTVMLTGDGESSSRRIAADTGIDRYYCSLMPADKVDKVEELMAASNGRGSLVFVGDGINDAPVISRADVGMAMGAMGSDAAIEAADVVLMDDDPAKVSSALTLARRCMRIVYENIWFAIGVKLICLVLGALGLGNMWMAIFADVGVMILAVLNALRVML